MSTGLTQKGIEKLKQLFQQLGSNTQVECRAPNADQSLAIWAIQDGGVCVYAGHKENVTVSSFRNLRHQICNLPILVRLAAEAPFDALKAHLANDLNIKRIDVQGMNLTDKQLEELAVVAPTTLRIRAKGQTLTGKREVASTD